MCRSRLQQDWYVLGFHFAGCWHREGEWELNSTRAALQGCMEGRAPLAWEDAPEGTGEAVPTSAFNQHVQELVHLLTSCHLLQQTTKRRVEGIRRRVPPATSQGSGSSPHEWLCPLQEKCHSSTGLAVTFR